VIKGLGKQLVRVGGIAGATIMGTGDIVLILNVADLIRLGLRGERSSVLKALEETTSPTDIRAKHRILIVDDSITTRTLEKNILEAIGYNVQVATDGQEALDTIAASGVPDLIISDVMMPRLDGFELTKQIKADPKTANVPVILVTSLGSSEDKTRGIEAGADAYIVKSAFDQSNLLETIEQLI
jgi:two-component system chemotaxis sensor kinase CheA